MDNLKQKSVKAFIWDFAGKLGNQTVGFVISIFLARLLAPEDFGLLAMVNVVIAISAAFMDMGLGSALIQKKNVTEEHYGAVFLFNLTVGIILAVALFFSSSMIARFYGKEIIGDLAKVMAPIFVINSFGNVLRFKLRKELNFSIATKASVTGAIISGVVGVAMAFMGYGVWALVIQTLSSALLSNAYLYIFVKNKPSLQYSFSALKDLWTFGFRMFASGMLDTIYRQIDALIIGKLFSAAALGYYFRAKSLNSYIIQYSSGSLMTVLFPVISKLQDDLQRLKTVVYKSFHILNFIAFFLIGFLYLCAADIIIILFSTKWLPAIPYFRILLLSSFAFPLSSLLVNILSGTGNSKDFLNLEVIKRVFGTINLVVGFSFGINGYLYGLAITGTISVLANIYFAAKQMQVTNGWFLKIIYPYLALTVALLLLLVYIENLVPNIYIHLLLSGALFTLLYFGIAKAMKLPGLMLLASELHRVFPKNKLVKRLS